MDKMSYGEAMIKARESYDIVDGVAMLKLLPHQKRKSKKGTIIYYNKKLFKYWLTKLADEIPKHKREEVLKYLLGARSE